MSKNVVIIGQMDNSIDHTFESANRVYSITGIAPTIPTCGGGGIQPKILEVKMKQKEYYSIAMRGRYSEKNKTNQQFEIGSCVSNAITTVSKDCMVFEVQNGKVHNERKN